MKFITFKQFIYTINIRYCHNDLDDNYMIRLYYGTEHKKDNYIEIGWYDFFNKDTIWNILENSLNKKILDSIVTDFRYNEDYGCIEVYICSEKELGATLEEYQN